MAATSAFQIGVNYSEWLSFPASGTQLATDSSGATYFLTSTLQSNIVLSTGTKLTPDGKKRSSGRISSALASVP